MPFSDKVAWPIVKCASTSASGYPRFAREVLASISEAEVRTHLLTRVPHQVSNSSHLSPLTYAVNSTESLLFDHGIPVRLEEVGSRSCDQVDACAATCDRDEDDADRIIGLKSANGGVAFGKWNFPVEPSEVYSSSLKLGLDKVQCIRPLREDYAGKC